MPIVLIARILNYISRVKYNIQPSGLQTITQIVRKRNILTVSATPAYYRQFEEIPAVGGSCFVIAVIIFTSEDALLRGVGICSHSRFF